MKNYDEKGISVANNIRRFRIAQGITQEQMAEELDISQNAYSKIENSITKLDMPRFFRIAEALKINYLDLLQINGRPI